MSAELAILNPEQARNALALIAEREVGVREKGGNNRGPDIVRYQTATWTPPGAWPWCAAFICWIIREWLKAPSVREVLHLTGAAADQWRPQTTGAFDFIRWAKEQKLQVLGENAELRRGDLVVFDHSHIGIAVADSERGEIKTVDGNTNASGDRDSEAGDGVWVKHRPRGLAKAFIRLV